MTSNSSWPVMTGPNGGFIYSDYGDDQALGITDAPVQLFIVPNVQQAVLKSVREARSRLSATAGTLVNFHPFTTEVIARLRGKKAFASPEHLTNVPRSTP